MRKNLLLSTVVFVLCIGGLELAARLLEGWAREPGDPTASGASWQVALFRQFGGLHESDPELLWRHRADLPDPFRTNSQHTFGAEFSRAKPASVYRILVLGDSTPVGIGMVQREDAFGEVLAGMLAPELAAAGRAVELVNAADPDTRASRSHSSCRRGAGTSIPTWSSCTAATTTRRSPEASRIRP